MTLNQKVARAGSSTFANDALTLEKGIGGVVNALKSNPLMSSTSITVLPASGSVRIVRKNIERKTRAAIETCANSGPQSFPEEILTPTCTGRRLTSLGKIISTFATRLNASVKSVASKCVTRRFLQNLEARAKKFVQLLTMTTSLEQFVGFCVSVATLDSEFSWMTPNSFKGLPITSGGQSAN